MPNLAENATLARDVTFRDRLLAAIVQRALVGADEAKPNSTDQSVLDKWKERRGFARAVLSSPGDYVERFVWLIAADPAVLAASESNPAQIPDANIEAALDSVWQLQIKINRGNEA